MSSVRTGSLLSALVGGLLSVGACNKSFAPIPMQGAGGFVGSRGGSTGSPGTTGVAGRPGTLIDGGSRLALDGGSVARDAGLLPHCASIVPTGPIIADFDAFNDQVFGAYGIDPVIGVAFTSGGLLQDFSAGNWHLTGTVTGPASFGFNWKCPGVIDGVCTLDLSRSAGIQATLSGDIGSAGSIRLTMGTTTDDVPASPSACGTCVPDAFVTCTNPSANFSLGSAVVPSQAVNWTWNYVAGGDPFAYLDAGLVTSITWTLPAAMDGGSYPVDFTLDDIRLIPIPR